MKAAFLAGLVALALALALALASVTAASAADADRHRPRVRSSEVAPLPVAPDSLSATVLASDYCWRACEAHCGWQVRKCTRHMSLTDCLPHNDSCDRSCVKQCRTYGGPLLDWTD